MRTMRAIPICILTLPIGCEYSPPGPPFDYPMATIEGKITLAGVPVDRGWVQFSPIHGTVGDHVIARIKDGFYRTEKAPVGELQVRIELPRPDSANIARAVPHLGRRLDLFRGNASPLRAQTTAGATVAWSFDLQ